MDRPAKPAMKITPPPNFLAKQLVDSLRALRSTKDHDDTGSGLRTLPELVAMGVKAKRQDSTQYILVSSDLFIYHEILSTDSFSRI